ncbi:hypothetical protein [Litchfieldella xinjiangensis]|uniref:hypothetical protein n=1 Tax=Litchfieldella xinjiangensis TaxID=1166948 RepID=UPI0005BCDCEE|nr:hypothetical protein [Halomonas xinjiangensis]
MRTLAAGMLLTAALPAFADGKALIHTGDAQESLPMVVHWNDEHVRMDFPTQEHGYLLLRGDDGFMIARQGEQLMIIEMDRLKNMTDAMGDEAESMSESQAESVQSLEATGETETIAGIEGDLYRVAWTDLTGNTHDNEIVLSDDPLAKDMLRAFQRYVITVMDEGDPIGDAVIQRDLGMLRFDDKFYVEELSGESPSPDLFELPDDAMTMEQLFQQHSSGTDSQ